MSSAHELNGGAARPATGLKRSRVDDGKSSLASTPRVNPDERYCNYYVARKHRFCKTERKPGAEYCPTHLTEVATATGTVPKEETRVPCPINPNHTVFASRLEKHVKVCPDLRFVTSKLPYFSEDKHGGRGQGFYTSGSPPRFTHRDLPESALNALISKVTTYYRQCVEPHLLQVTDLGVSGDVACLRASAEAPHSQKHGPQHAALLQCVLFAWSQHLKAVEHISSSSSSSRTPSIAGFLELGAGKGGLSVALQHVLTSEEASEVAEGPGGACPTSLAVCTVASPRLVVVDFDSFRRKGDARVSHSRIRLERWRINIKDLNLTAAFTGTSATLRETGTASAGAVTSCTTTATDTSLEPWVAIGKHLCGACSDFALSCLTEAHLGPRANVEVVAVVLATCCHHRCELRHMNPVQACSPQPERTHDPTASVRLPGSDEHLSEREFAALTSMSSWTVSGSAVDDARREVGFYCKRILDAMRAAYLREHGFVTRLCVYTSRDVTEENVCIVAWKSP